LRQSEQEWTSKVKQKEMEKAGAVDDIDLIRKQIEERQEQITQLRARENEVLSSMVSADSDASKEEQELIRKIADLEQKHLEHEISMSKATNTREGELMKEVQTLREEMKTLHTDRLKTQKQSKEYTDLLDAIDRELGLKKRQKSDYETDLREFKEMNESMLLKIESLQKSNQQTLSLNANMERDLESKKGKFF